MSEHTPGPWTFGRIRVRRRTGSVDSVLHVWGARDEEVAMVDRADPDAEADAALIARAPDLLAEVATLRAQLERAQRDRDELRSAAQAMVEWAWDPDEDQLEQFERIAHEFYLATGMLRPGKSEPLGMGDRTEERHAAWEKWRRQRSRETLAGLRAALEKAREP